MYYLPIVRTSSHLCFIADTFHIIYPYISNSLTKVCTRRRIQRSATIHITPLYKYWLIEVSMILCSKWLNFILMLIFKCPVLGCWNVYRICHVISVSPMYVNLAYNVESLCVISFRWTFTGNKTGKNVLQIWIYMLAYSALVFYKLAYKWAIHQKLAKKF